MAINGVNSNTNVAAASGSKKTMGKSSLDTGLSVNDFLSLIAAQLQNQDMMNPMKDTEFMGQLAQFTQLQATQNLVELNTTSYAANLIGKEITTATMSSTGKLETNTGVVTGVSLFEGRPIVYIGDKSYELAQIMSVGKLPKPEEPPKEPEEPKDPADTTKP